ncbi:uncharacterized protein HMPREF1541_04570 [Cyphellophora europaea CBS 101466]|uniref:RNA polymerase II holoenzyme cyclin-like subunit n=1 Tax=Cyphellophora europaea (strain CBS 101466) TaxID=1220924 RepID=W2RX63_CYPE1|nr:uncharacterized protein HMPREF1541_04570 [Cyphellophora europaea CBS 101466]ETN40294.1 hypothetical protein HMPREF1541_04570 [Cyphellophora europaea CBS 101466]
MIEDDFYRSSTQYRHWSFTHSQLSERRAVTNAHAAARVRAAFHRAQTANGNDASYSDGEVDTLTVDEELKIIEWGSNKIVEMGKLLHTPSSLQSTAIQYLRRFYLTNSPMTYHPKSIIACALFLATKADHQHVSVRAFAEETNVTEDEVKAPEFLLLQGIKFTLDVRHPFRGLEGGSVEMRELITEGRLLSGEKEAVKRLEAAIVKAKGFLRREAQMTDVYFLYTPAQIWLAAMLMADSELTVAYLTAKFESLLASEPPVGADLEALQSKLTATVRKCATMLEEYKSPEDDKKERKELGRIGKKLAKCQDPEKTDIVAVAKAKKAEKREGSESEREGEKKKRRTEREKLGKDGDVFGGDLKDIR